MPLSVSCHTVESLGSALEPFLQTAPHMLRVSVVHPGMLSWDTSQSYFSSGTIPSTQLLELINWGKNAASLTAVADSDDADVLVLKNASLELFLSKESYHRCPNLGQAHKLPHSKQGHGAKNSVAHSYRIVIDISDRPLAQEVIFAVNEVFFSSTVEIVSYGTDPAPISHLAAVTAPLKHTPINGKIDTSVLTSEPRIDQSSAEDLEDFYEYLSLLVLNSSSLIHGSVDSYISSYEPPKGSSESQAHLSLSSVEHIHSKNLTSLLLQDWVVLSFHTKDTHTVLYKTPQERVITWSTAGHQGGINQ